VASNGGVERGLLLYAGRGVDSGCLELELLPATGAEATAARRVGRRGHVAHQDDPLPPLLTAGGASRRVILNSEKFGIQRAKLRRGQAE
jgi:hypothetical protein